MCNLIQIKILLKNLKLDRQLLILPKEMLRLSQPTLNQSRAQTRDRIQSQKIRGAKGGCVRSVEKLNSPEDAGTSVASALHSSAQDVAAKHRYHMSLILFPKKAGQIFKAGHICV